MLISLHEDQFNVKKLKVMDGNKAFIISMEKDQIPVSFDWISSKLDLKFEMASEDQFFSSEKEDSGLYKGNDKMEKKCREEWASVRNRKNVRKMPNSLQRPDILGGTKVKGKQPYVKISKKRPTFGLYREGKLDLEKKKICHVRGVGGASSTSPSESESEEGQLMGVGEGRGECSRWRQIPKESLSKRQYGLEKGVSDNGLQKSVEAQSMTSEDRDGQYGHTPREWGDNSSSKGFEVGAPKKMLVRHKDHSLVSISDQEGRGIIIPLKGPITFPLQNSEGGQIRADDLESVPLTVDLGNEGKRGNQKAKHHSVNDRWSLQKELAKVIEKGFSRGYSFNQDFANTVEERSWSLSVEIAKVIEVGMALGVDFNGKEDSIEKEIAQREMEDEIKLLNVLIKGRHIVDTSIEFFDSFPPPPSSQPVGTFHPNVEEISVADDASQVLTLSAISAVILGSTIENRDRAQNTALENDTGRIDGSISTRTSTHNIGMHIHPL
ncbi:hypothetical protein LWI29_013022 [Acer saccharum]|uniref:Uncharacterized protein n=1 Tax=Acer saccharum TaxID=4024 RepID=A0AA39SZF0_ACESA|nr:hypothetical protein LWI29_013022 [Acer saccharum]